MMFTRTITDNEETENILVCPDAVSASGSSESVDENERTATSRKAGHVSPQTICSRRKLSRPVVTDPNVSHGLLDGRKKIVLPLPLLSSTSSSTPTLSLLGTTRPSTTVFNSLLTNPSPMRRDAWAEVSATSFHVRGTTYLHDSVKVPSEPSLFRLLTVDMVACDQPNFRGMCSHPQERVQRALELEKETKDRLLPEFIFAVNLCIPSSGTTSSTAGHWMTTTTTQQDTSCYHWVAYFGIDDKSLITNDQTPVGRLAHKFFFGSSDAFRDSTFKLIPRIADGNFVVRKAVGSKPSLLGTKLKQHYIRSDRFFEVVVDIGSDVVAQRIVRLALGYAKNLTVDMMFLLEAKSSNTLPERILGGVQVKNVDFHEKDGQRVCPSYAT